MGHELQLFGKPVVAYGEETLCDQVCQILTEEIRAGRWKIGERLPGISTLSKQSGVSPWPIHRAYDLLQKKGVLRIEDRRGAFVESLERMEPPAYGVLLPKAGLSGAPLFPFRQIAVREIMDQAMQRRAVIEMLQMDETEDTSTLDLRNGGPFSSRVRGIISLFPFPHSNHGTLSPDRIPLVFQGPYITESLPTITGDTFYGMYRLTRNAIELGHRSIALCCHEFPLDAPPFQERIRAFETALAESNLSYDHDLFNQTRQLSFADLSEAADLLMANRHITAWICLMPYPAQRLAMAAEFIDLRVPEDLSIACFGEGAVTPSQPERRLTSYGPDTEQIVRHCFNVLDEQRRIGRCTQSMVLVRPSFHRGHSMAAPRAAAARHEISLSGGASRY